MPHYENSYQSGLAAENKVLPVIRSYFQRDIRKIPWRYAKHDFECADYFYELKSRNNRKDTFPDTLIAVDKFTELTKPLILLFCFTDCLCSVEYDKERFEKYKKVLFGRVDRNADEAKIHIYIPIADLTKIAEWHNDLGAIYTLE
jgi:hypothetical protein